MQHVYYIQRQYFHVHFGSVANLYDALLHINECSYFDEEVQSKEQIRVVCVHHKENHLTHDPSHFY